jgi:membrane associated rhomboid family serine protease
MVILSVALSCAPWIVHAATADQMFDQTRIAALFGLSAESIASARYWQFLSFALIHDGPLHLVANLLLLYFAGREVEPIIGGRHFAGLFLIANFTGALVQWGAMVAGWTPPGTVLVGISAGTAAVVTAFATILPELEVTVLLFFVLPLRVRAKLFGFALLGTAAALWLGQAATSIGPFGIAAGCLVGWIYAKALGFGNPLAVERYFLERRQQASRLDRMPVDQFIAEEIDPVLEKLARGGMRSLTRAEKRLLQRGSAKLGARKP